MTPGTPVWIVFVEYADNGDEAGYVMSVHATPEGAEAARMVLVRQAWEEERILYDDRNPDLDPDDDDPDNWEKNYTVLREEVQP